MAAITLGPVVVQLPLGSLPEFGHLFTAPQSILDYDQTTCATRRTNGSCDYQSPSVAHEDVDEPFIMLMYLQVLIYLLSLSHLLFWPTHLTFTHPVALVIS